MNQSNDLARIYQELRRIAVAQFGDDCTVEPEWCLRIAAEQIFYVDNAEVHPDLEPLNQ